jgi:hypothetical protein
MKISATSKKISKNIRKCRKNEKQCCKNENITDPDLKIISPTSRYYRDVGNTG